MNVPACVNCGDPLGLSSLYCAACIRLEGETWGEWRARLADVRERGSYSVPRACPCGGEHLSRALYWQHRLDAEKAPTTDRQEVSS